MNKVIGVLHFLAKNSNMKLLVSSVLAGVINGVIAVLLIWNINTAIADEGNALLFFQLLTFSIFTHLASSYLITNLAEHNLYVIRENIVTSILGSEFREIELYGAGKIYSSLTQDAAILSGTASLLPHIISSFSIVLACLIYIISLSISIGILLIISLIIGVSVYFLLQKPLYKYYDKNRNYHNNLHSYYSSLIYGNRELKHDHKTSKKLTKLIFLKTLKSIKVTKVKVAILESLAGAWGNLVVFIALGSIVYTFPIINFNEKLPANIVSSIVTALVFTLGSVYALIGLFPSLISASISYDRIQSIALNKEESSPYQKDLECRKITFEEISYSYKTTTDFEKFTVGPISFSIKKGEVTLITGGNGSGKTTLQKLITGIYKTQSGNILCADTVISPETRSDYRKLFSVIWSDCYIFDQLYLDDEDKDKFEYWLNRLEIKDKVKINHTSRLINHKELSSGQKKRLSLAITLAKVKNFVVLDEWAAEQSPEFKNIFYREILQSIKDEGLGVVIISHDDRYFDIADKIITLESGYLVDEKNTQFLNIKS